MKINKTLGILFLAVILLGCLTIVCLFVLKQQKTKTRTLNISFIVDKTDSMRVQPEVDAIESYIDFEKYKWYHITVFTQIISAFEYNAIQEFAVSPPSWILFENPTLRKKKIKQLQQKVFAQLENIRQQEKGTIQSTLYSVIAREANRLNKLEGETELLVYSDLRENSAYFSIYNAKDEKMLREHSQQVRARLQKVVPLERYRHLSIHFIFQPTTLEEDHQFKLMATLLTEMFSDFGAKVTVGSSLVH